MRSKTSRSTSATSPARVPLAGGALDPNHGLLIGDNGDLNVAPSAVNAFALPNANRPQVTVTLPGSTNKVPALTAMREWVRFAVRTPNAPLAGLAQRGRSPPTSPQAAHCSLRPVARRCHGGQNWTISLKDFTSPPAAAEIFTERNPTHVHRQSGRRAILEPVLARHRFVQPRRARSGQSVRQQHRRRREGRAGGGQRRPASRRRTRSGMITTATAKALASMCRRCWAFDAVPPYMHNGAAESLAAVVADVKHRTDNGRLPDRLS